MKNENRQDRRPSTCLLPFLEPVVFPLSHAPKNNRLAVARGQPQAFFHNRYSKHTGLSPDPKLESPCVNIYYVQDFPFVEFY